MKSATDAEGRSLKEDTHWIVSYKENVVVGACPWNGNYTTVPAMGSMSDEFTVGYMEEGDMPTFKLLDTNTGETTDMRVVSDLQGWSNNSAYVVELEAAPAIPDMVSLNKAYPNPFNPSTNLTFDIPAEMHVSLAVYDVAGRLVEQLVNEVRTAESYTEVWNADIHASGVYFVKLTAGSTVQTQKIMLIK